MDVQRDLSAHYGSHALRRGLAKPFGPCVHPLLRKGKLSVARAGVHGPRYMRVWKLSRAHRCWCSRCGVWLTRGVNSTHQRGEHIISTVTECRVRQRGIPHRSRAARKASPTKKFTVCCVRCFNQAHQAAIRAVGKRSSGVKPVVERGTKTADVHENGRQKAKLAVAAVVAAARVPKRNRRRCRRSARRPYRDEQVAPKGKRKAPSLSAAAASTATYLHQTLAASLTRKKTTADTPSAKTGAAATSVAPLARTAQKRLQGLVPSGPLKKLQTAPRPSETERLRSPKTESSAVLPFPATVPPALPPPSIISGIQEQYRSRAAEVKGSRNAGAPLPEKKVAASKKSCPAPNSTTSAVNSTTHKAIRSPSTEGTAHGAAAAPSPPPAPKRTPVKAMPNKSVKAPVKAHAKTTGKSKLMDAMSQLGF
ncbi:hypothetical protein ABL78_2940 [Leptomonas seymouri]|uniref:Uncharacterized protein n=1 Tax=Leptomonas seymouri TaxID=5684 RepID=A0A0N0P6S3_LEPSE|nr:hypothetical protein ABL78_2940 [Leptomonas seymouri]|eukprot:KPI87949.1 hypothetical protein ABL78_2940 [Leptomonas seymouri]